MHFVAWILCLVLLDVALLYLWIAVSLEENCGNGISRWSCAGALQDALPVLPYAFSVGVGLTILVMVWGAVSMLSRPQRPDNAAEKLKASPGRPPIDAIAEWPDEPPSLWDKTTCRAYKKQYGHWPDEPRAE